MTSRSYNQYCALARALDRVGDRWSMLIVRNLILGPQRFGQLRHNLPGIASNMLSGRLKSMVADAIITQKGDLYSLSELGRQLEPILFSLATWGEQFLVAPPSSKDHLRMRFAMTSLKRRITPLPMRPQKRISLTPQEPLAQSYTFICGPEPDVAQDQWPGADLNITASAEAIRAFFFMHQDAMTWLKRPDVTLDGELGALETLRQSFPNSKVDA